MTRPYILCVTILALAAATAANAAGSRPQWNVARRAASLNKAISAKAIEELRSAGPEGLEIFLEANKAELAAAITNRDAAGKATMQALDSICQQKDCYASRLYWYTDIEAAKKASRASGKPILSLRLLGRLDEDLSCANSRFFRITLYANDEISQYLRDHYILHWQSVRPVPKITIDFGDGRKMERTITGNSIHYILDSEGHVIDALPGLYGPEAFLRELVRTGSIADEVRRANESDRANLLRAYHQKRIIEIDNEWIADVKRASLTVAPSRTPITNPAGNGAAPTASVATAGAMTKALRIEKPLLRGAFDNTTFLDKIAADPGWNAIAALHSGDAKLDAGTRRLIAFKDPSLQGRSLQQALTSLESSIAQDTVRNEYVFHARIHQWLAGPLAEVGLETLNNKIYDELFLTPSSDAWLGLRPFDSYSGIDNDGIRK